MERLKALLDDLIQDHWLKALTGLLLFFVGRWWGKRRARSEWDRKEFMHRMMVTLNSIYAGKDGRPTLAIRTLVEKDMKDILLNEIAVEKVLAAAGKTTAQNPILPLAREDRWFVLNAVLNDLAEKFAVGTMARDMGRPVAIGRYLIVLTNEIAGAVRTHKVRAMVVRKDLLLDGRFEKDLAIESSNHSTRLETLAFLRQTYSQEPDHFLEIEVPVIE